MADETSSHPPGRELQKMPALPRNVKHRLTSEDQDRDRERPQRLRVAAQENLPVARQRIQNMRPTMLSVMPSGRGVFDQSLPVTPIVAATTRAVCPASPVTITVRTPKVLSSATNAAESARGGSLRAICRARRRAPSGPAATARTRKPLPCSAPPPPRRPPKRGPTSPRRHRLSDHAPCCAVRMLHRRFGELLLWAERD